jgi:hypothetical protein
MSPEQMKEAFLCRFKNEKIAEHWGVADQLALMAQIGALPKPPQGRP